MKTITTILVMLITVVAVATAQGGREAGKNASGQSVAAAPPSGDSAAADFSSRTLSSEELAAIMAEKDPNTYLVDVRTAGEFDSGAIPGAINIPHTEIADNLPTEDRSARIIVYCRSGNRSGMAASILEDLGYTNVNDFGGVYRWTGDLVRGQ
jgi:rhodanese-related sulfurtransferase